LWEDKINKRRQGAEDDEIVNVEKKAKDPHAGLNNSLEAMQGKPSGRHIKSKSQKGHLIGAGSVLRG